MRELHVFDLDGTVICSAHRKATLPCGNIDLDHWREYSTPEKIEADSPLGLSALMRGLYSQPGIVVVVCTARVMARADWQWLEHNNLHFHYALSRGEQDTRPDAEMKRTKLIDLFSRINLPVSRYKDVTLYDDNQAVITMAQSLGLLAVDATKINSMIKGLLL